jgi:hypothetical protein
LSEKNSWAKLSAYGNQAGAGRQKGAHKGHVEEAQQEQGEHHPYLKAGISGKDGALTCHDKKVSGYRK